VLDGAGPPRNEGPDWHDGADAGSSYPRIGMHVGGSGRIRMVQDGEGVDVVGGRLPGLVAG
jgi:hypothetical protein